MEQRDLPQMERGDDTNPLPRSSQPAAELKLNPQALHTHAVVSWNVNGLRSMCPEGLSDLFNLLPDNHNIGFLCLQETKLSRLVPDLCISDNYYSYFSRCRNSRDTGRDRGYAGVGTFVRKDIPTLRAQQGFIGCGDPAEDILPFSAMQSVINNHGKDDMWLTWEDASALSEEGRVMMTGM